MKGESKNKGKAKKRQKRQMSLISMFLLVFLVFTILTITIGSFNTQYAYADLTGDNFELYLDLYDSTVNNGNTKLQSISWNAVSQTEARTIKQQITYRNTNAIKDYAPGELEIKISGLNDIYEIYRDHIAYGEIVVAADEASATTKQYDWSYTYDSTNNIYTFVNNRAIEAKTNFEGTIQIAYNFKADGIIQVDETQNAVLNGSVISNDVSFEYTSNTKDYDVSKTATKITSYDGLPNNADNYIWVKYRFEIDATNSDGVRPLDVNKTVYFSDNIADEGCIVLDKKLNVLTPNTNNDYSANMDVYGTSSRFYYQYLVVGYPKDTYTGKTIKNKVDVYGTYKEEEQVSFIGSSEIEVNLADFEFEYTGNLYDMVKDSYPLTEISYNPVYKGHPVMTNWRIKVSAVYTGRPMTIRIGDDIVGITSSNGSYDKLTDDEYYFDSVSINFDYFKNGNDQVLTPYTYNCAIYVRYAGTDEYVRYGSGFQNQNGTKQITFLGNTKVVGWYFEMYDVTESIKNPTSWMTYQITTKLMINRKENVAEQGRIYNFDYLQVFFRDGNGDFVLQNEAQLENYVDDLTKENIATYDMANYGKYLQRSYDYVNYKGTILNLYISKFVNTPTKDLNSEYYYSSFDITFNYNFEENNGSTNSNFEGYRLYDLLPEGMELDATGDEILDTLSCANYYKILKSDGTKFATQQSYKDFVREHSVINIDKDYKGSGRTYIELIVDYRDEPLDFYEFQGSMTETIDKYSIPIKVSFDSYLTIGSKYTNYAQFMYIYDYEMKNAGYDTGSYGDALSADIDNDGLTTDRVVRGTATLNILDAVSSHQDVIKTVKTDKTDGEYWLSQAKASLGSEYEYKLRIRTGESSVKDLVIYDNIETVESDDERWQGTFVGVSTSEVEKKGYAPVVYYSENTVTGRLDESDEWKELVYDGTKGLWVVPDGVAVSTVKSICVDLRKGTDGADKITGKNSILYCGLVLKAPSTLPKEGTIGRNNMCYTNWRALDETTGEFVDNISGINSNEVNVEIDIDDLTTTVAGKKTWDDSDDKEGLRPDSITIKLLRNGVEYLTKTVTENENWEYSFENLPVYKSNGAKYEYTIQESAVDNYLTKYENYDVTNEVTVISIEAQKVWDDNNNEALKRPTSVILQVKDGDKLLEEHEVSEADGWKYTFKGLPKYRDDGSVIVYTIDEKDIENDFYTKNVVGNVVTNKFVVSDEKIKINGIKDWNDNNNAAGKRPSSVILQIKNGDTVVDEKEVTAGTNWSCEFEVAKYDALGNEITYTIDEKDTGSKFYVKESVNGYQIVNKFEVPDEKIELEAVKVWDDNNNAASKRDESIVLQVKEGERIVKEQEVSEATNWTCKFTDLPKYDANGDEIVYTVDEQDTGNKFYIKNIVGNTVVNKFIVPSDKVEVTGTKVWDDNNNKALKRDESIILQVKNGNTVVAEQEVSEATNWTYTFTNLPKYDDLGNEIVYTIDERDTGNKFYTKELTNNTTVTNKFVVPDEKVEIKGIKLWEDSNNAALKRDESVTLQVKNGNTVVAEQVVNEANGWTYIFSNLAKYDSLGNEIAYTIDEKNTGNKFYIKENTNATTVTNRFVVPDERIKITGIKVWDDNNNAAGKRPESVTLQVKNGNTVVTEKVVDKSNNWKYEFELAKYDENGDEINYTIDEKDTGSKFYIKELTNSTTVTNKFVVPDEKVEVEVIKVWDDNENKALKRDESIVLQVKNGDTVVAEQVVNEEMGWKYTFGNLPKYDENGDEIIYTVDEINNNIYYVKEIADNVITNRFVVPDTKIKIKATKIWDDNDNIALKRPEGVTLQIKANDEVIAEKVVNAGTDWSYEFELAKYDEDGNEIIYTIDERDIGSKFYEKQELENIDMLDQKIANKFVVPNEKITVKVMKTWDDNENEAGKRPETVTLQVKNGESVVAEKEVTKEEDYKCEFELPKYDELGNEINYTVDEKEFDSLFYIKNIVGNVITNKFVVPDERIKITGTKIWDDNNNEALKRPESVILQVKAGSNVVAEGEVNEKNNWKFEFELAKYDKNGDEIVYTLDERRIESKFYEKVEVTNEDMLNQIVKNKFVVPKEETLVKAVKKWEDNNNLYNKRPDKVVLQVKVGNKVIAEQTVNEECYWNYEFKLPKYDELGNEINYTVDEKSTPKYYEKRIEGETVINTCTYIPPVNTGDVNISTYIITVLIAMLGIIGGTYIIRNKNKRKVHVTTRKGS